jgi:hypothetical protein
MLTEKGSGDAERGTVMVPLLLSPDPLIRPRCGHLLPTGEGRSHRTPPNFLRDIHDQLQLLALDILSDAIAGSR